MIEAKVTFNRGRLRAKLGGMVKKKAERVAQKAVNGFIERSPVFRGHFRASWNVSEGRPVYIRVDGGTPENPLSPPTIVVKARTDFPTFFITNGQPYAKKIEEGSSKQAPVGVVRVTLAGLR